MKNKPYRLAVFALNPIIYQAPLWKLLSAHLRIELTVLYGDRFEADWRVPLLDGYTAKFLRNRTWRNPLTGGFWRRINPGVISDLWRNRYDAVIIHGYDTATAWMMFFAAKLSRTPIVFRGEANLRPNQSGLRPQVKELVVPHILSFYDSVLYSCTGNVDYCKHYKVSNHGLFLAPCAVDNAYYQREREYWSSHAEEIRSELNITPTGFVIISVAHITQRKRQLDLLAAVKKLQDEGYGNITVLLIGSKVDSEPVERFIRDNLLMNVHLLGFINQKEISRYYVVADLGVVLSEYDPSPKTLNEMMNFAMPIICTDVVGTVKDLVHEGINGFVVEVGDIEMIARHIRELAANRERARQMGQKSLEIVSEWNFDRDVEGVLAAVEYAISRHRHR